MRERVSYFIFPGITLLVSFITLIATQCLEAAVFMLVLTPLFLIGMSLIGWVGHVLIKEFRESRDDDYYKYH